MLVGAWKLKLVELTESKHAERYSDISGLLLYTEGGYFSVSLKLSTNPEKVYSESLIPNYYAAGKFRLNGDVITEENLVHALDSRTGEKRDVKVVYDENQLTQNFEFGPETKLKMVWKRDN